MCPASVPAPKNDCTPVVNVADDVSSANETAPVVPPPLKPLPAVTALMSPVSDIANTPPDALSPEPAIADTKSAIASFFELLSPASIIAILSFATSTVAADSSFKSSEKVTVFPLHAVSIHVPTVSVSLSESKSIDRAPP